MPDVNHGNSLAMRYAHALKMLVKTGDLATQDNKKLPKLGTMGHATGFCFPF